MANDMKTGRLGVFSELLSRTFYAKTIHIMIPVMLQQLITVGINFLDNIMVGRFGESQIAAASLGNQVYSLFQFICMGLGSGAIVMSAQYWGAKEKDKLKTVASLALRLTGALSIVFMVIVELFPQQVLYLFTNESGVIADGIGYLRLIGATMLFAGMSSTATYLLRSTGHVKVPLYSSIAAFFINLFFNWVFIFGKFGAPRMEIMGAAVGTVISRAFEFAVIFGYFVLKDENIGFRVRHFFVSGREIIGKYMKYSLPVLVSDTLLGVGLAVTSAIIGHVGAELMAANSIVVSASQLMMVVNVGCAGATAVVIGNSIGENETDRAYREGAAYCVIAVGIGVVMSILMILLKNPYLSLYSINESTIQTAHSLFWCLIITSPLQMLSYITSKGILRGGGDTRFLLFGDISLLWILSIPLGYLGAFVWNLSPFWIFFLLKLEFTTKGLLCTWRFCTKRWIKVIQKDPMGA